MDWRLSGLIRGSVYRYGLEAQRAEMRNMAKTKRELVEEITALKLKVQELERFGVVHRQLEDVLREREELFRSVVGLTSDCMWEISGDGLYTYASPNIKDLLGYEPEEIIGKSPFDLMPEDRAGEAAAAFRKISDARLPFCRVENVSIHKDGREMILETNGVPIIDARGNCLGYRGSHRDITGCKRMEQALRESERKFMDLSEGSLAGVYLVQDGVFRYVNAKFARTLGYETQEMIGKMTVKETILPEDWPVVEENMLRRISGEPESIHYEFRAVTKDKRIKNAEVYGSRTVYRGKPAIMGTYLDITDRKRSEEQEKHSARLSAALEMAGAVCHELNQPLQVISARIHLLFMENPEDRTREGLQMVSDQIDRIGAITKKLMGLKKYSNRDYIGTIKITDIGQTPEEDVQ